MPHENRRTLVLPLTHRKWRRAKNETRTMAHKEAVTTTSSSTTSPKQPPRLVYFIGSSRNVRARQSILHLSDKRTPHIRLETSLVRRSPDPTICCARPSCAPEYALGSVEHHQTAQLLHKPSTPYPPCTAAAFSKVASCIQSGGNNPQTIVHCRPSPPMRDTRVCVGVSVEWHI